MYPNVHNIDKVQPMMAVSIAFAERSFSCLRRLKTYLRNSMTGTLALITGLAVMSIHTDFDIDTERIFRAFDATRTRRVDLSL